MSHALLHNRIRPNIDMLNMELDTRKFRHINNQNVFLITKRDTLYKYHMLTYKWWWIYIDIYRISK